MSTVGVQGQVKMYSIDETKHLWASSQIHNSICSCVEMFDIPKKDYENELRNKIGRWEWQVDKLVSGTEVFFNKHGKKKRKLFGFKCRADVAHALMDSLKDMCEVLKGTTIQGTTNECFAQLQILFNGFWEERGDVHGLGPMTAYGQYSSLMGFNPPVKGREWHEGIMPVMVPEPSEHAEASEIPTAFVTAAPVVAAPVVAVVSDENEFEFEELGDSSKGSEESSKGSEESVERKRKKVNRRKMNDMEKDVRRYCSNFVSGSPCLIPVNGSAWDVGILFNGLTKCYPLVCVLEGVKAPLRSGSTSVISTLLFGRDVYKKILVCEGLVGKYKDLADKIVEVGGGEIIAWQQGTDIVQLKNSDFDAAAKTNVGSLASGLISEARSVEVRRWLPLHDYFQRLSGELLEKEKQRNPAKWAAAEEALKKREAATVATVATVADTVEAVVDEINRPMTDDARVEMLEYLRELSSEEISGLISIAAGEMNKRVTLRG